MTLTERPYDAGEFPLCRFAIKPDGHAMNLFVRQGNDWREIFLFDNEDPALSGEGTVIDAVRDNDPRCGSGDTQRVERA